MRTPKALANGHYRVRFNEVVPGFNGGEVAAFPPAIAARYVELELAEYVDFTEPVEPKPEAKEKPDDPAKGVAQAATRQDGPKRSEHRKKR